jgi:[acyl-carrier-protein] S-malonyltransferase
MCEEYGAAGVTRLPITIACHTPLMAPAAERVASLLADLTLLDPATAFYSTVDASPKQSSNAIAAALVDGITKPVRFAATVERLLADGITAFVEIGPGRVLRGLLRDAVPRSSIESIASDVDADQVMRRDQES